jgi:prefoldin subunit 5
MDIRDIAALLLADTHDSTKAMWESPKPIVLDSQELDSIWSWYKDWVDGEKPDLDEEDLEMIKNHIEDLFGYVAHLRRIYDDVEQVKDEMQTVKSAVQELKLHKTLKGVKDEMQTVRSAVQGLKSRKRKVLNSTQAEDKAPKRRRVRKRRNGGLEGAYFGGPLYDG